MNVNRRQEYLNLIVTLLRATDESNGNQQAVYSILEGNQELLDDNFAQLLRSWALTALSQDRHEVAQTRVAVIFMFSYLIWKYPLGSRASNLEIAISGYEIVATVYTREAFPQDWGKIQTNLGVAYCDRIRGDTADNLERAIGYFQAALAILTFEEFPQERALVQHSLGNAYIGRIRGETADNIEKAIECYQAALPVRTREAFPQDWALTLNCLGAAYTKRIRGEIAGNLEKAIECYQSALQVITRQAYAEEWARIQHNLGTAYRSRIEGEKADNIEKAIKCYESALQVRTCDKLPEKWALTLKNLGLTYTDRIRGSKADNLEKAITCYNEALQVYTREAYPEYWAKTQNGLGNAYRERIWGEKADHLEKAINCHQAALQILTQQAFPQEWARTQHNLGGVYFDRIRGERAENLEEAIRFYKTALQVRTQQAFPELWALTQNNLGGAYRNRILGERAENQEEAIYFYKAALQIRTQQAFPELWAQTQNNLGNVYSQRIRGERADNLEKAIKCYEAALQVYTVEDFPQDWAWTKHLLGAVYLNRILEKKTDNLEEAINYFKNALQIYTYEAFPQEWAMTQESLGLAHFNRIQGQKADNIEVAIGYFQAALQVYTYEAFPQAWASTQNSLGEAYRNRIQGESTGNLKLAIDYLQKALQVRTQQAFPQDYIRTQWNLGLAYQAAQKFPNAYTAFEAAIDTLELLRGEIVFGSGKDEDKQKLAEEWNQLYRSMVEVCFFLATDEPQYYAQAIEYVERSKTRNLVELILNRDIETILPKDVVNQLKQFQDEIARNQYQLQTATADNPITLARHLQQLRQQSNQLQNKYLDVGDGFSFDRFRTTLDSSTAVVEFYITFYKFFVFIFTSKTQHPLVLSFEIRNLEKLVKWANGYLRAYTKKSHWQRRLLTRLNLLAKILRIDKIIHHIPEECKRLILIPHQYLHLFPLHALPITTQHGEPKFQILMDRFPLGVRYAPSCQLLQLAQTRQRLEFNTLVAVENPTGDLTYTNVEVEAIQSYFQKTYIFKKEKATKEVIDEVSLGTNTHCLHFSCHGYFNLAQPRKSALILANAVLNTVPINFDSEQHFILPNGSVLDLKQCLTLDNIFTLNLNQCRLITLSACETGLIDFDNESDEYIGLPSGFLYAGSPSVVSSLWTVNDLSTAFLMIQFYQNLRQEFFGVAEPKYESGDRLKLAGAVRPQRH